MESGDGWCPTAGAPGQESTQDVAPATEAKDRTNHRRAQEEARSIRNPARQRQEEDFRDEETLRHEAPRIASDEVVIARSLVITIRR